VKRNFALIVKDWRHY